MKNLIALQKVDNQLQDISLLLGDLPKMVEEINSQENQLKSKLESDKVRLKEVDVETHKKELLIDGIDTKVDKLTDQLFLVKNNKQYDALTSEIEHIKEEKSSMETFLLELIEEKELLESEIKNNDEKLEGLTSELSERREKLEKVLSETADEKNILDVKRIEVLKNIDYQTEKIYDKVLKSKNGSAVVPLSGTSCSGCGAALPMQTVAEIKSESIIHRCDVCMRFVHKEEN
tara:strand:+ start:1824 stop:2519 length:696 start_codon:yes stop_codon:yes gene_type:complete